MMRQIPIILGVLALIGLTVAEARMSGRFEGSSMTEEQFASLLKNVPMEIGDWKATELPVSDEVRETAGARGYVSREYKNTITGDRVNVWLIVGHAKDVIRHTPDICYPSSGFTMRAPENSLQSFVFDGQNLGDFFTNTFVKADETGRRLVRVFWSWHKPNEEGAVEWKAPEIVRWEFGNARSLFKLYFSNDMKDYRETTEESSSMKFAKEFLPKLDMALTTAGLSGEGDDSAAETSETPAEDASTT
jgi:Protein of unknown function (DUF3485)